MYVKDTDLVFEEEKNRSMNENLNRVQTGDISNLKPDDISNKFSIYPRGILSSNETGIKGPTFLSKDYEYPDSELDRTLVISSYKWYNDYNFVYSVDYDGIYVYNCQSRVNVKILDINEKIKINTIEENTIIYNETQEIKVNIN